MDEQKIEQELRSFFINEAKEVEPSSQWWDNAVFTATEPARISHFLNHISSLFSKPLLRVALPVAVLLLIVGTLWGTGILPGLQDVKSTIPAPTTTVPSATQPILGIPPPTATPPPRLLRVTAVTDKPSYLPGEQVEITVSLDNITGESLALSHFTYTEISRLGYILKTFDDDSRVFTLAPGKSTKFTLIWDQLDNRGIPVKPAIYQLAVEYINIVKSSAQETTEQSFHEIGQLQIEFPQGTLEKVIEVNQSQTADGITLTVERVKLSAERLIIVVLKTPGYTPSQTDRPEPPSRAGRAEIQGTYSIDNGAATGLGSFGYGQVANGIQYTWQDLYPVPADAHTLTFTITRFAPLTGSVIGDFDGPWEFTVQLQ
jgi:hypothetical protein